MRSQVILGEGNQQTDREEHTTKTCSTRTSKGDIPFRGQKRDATGNAFGRRKTLH